MTSALHSREPSLSGPHLSPFRYESTAATHPGYRRKLNEDACLNRSDIGLWAVADGMGGHNAGEIASTLVIESLDRVSAFSSAFAFRQNVRMALLEANKQLQDRADQQFSNAIGATVVALLAHGSHYACIWAGDSRAYLLRGRQFRRITRDHSLVEELVAAGKLARDQVRAHGGAHIVTRAVGARPELELDGVFGSLCPGDRFLLCSDGLGVLGEDVVAKLLADGDGRCAASALLRATLAAGAPDNVSVVVIDALA